MNYIHAITFDATKMDEYQRGLISGIMYMGSGMPDDTYTWSISYDKTEWYKNIVCTKEQYAFILDTIERLLPGVIKYKSL